MRTALSDLALLVVAFVIATWLRYGDLTFQELGTRGVLWNIFVTTLIASVIGSALAAAMSATAPPRPSYNRAMVMVVITFFTLAALIVLFRPWFSRSHLLLTGALWLVLVLWSRWAVRRRPWLEQAVVISSADDLIDQLRRVPHLRIVDVIDPSRTGSVAAPPQDAFIAIDLSDSWSDDVSRFISAASVGGREVRAFTQLYEEHTGKVPLSHVSEGWEMESSLRRTLPFIPFKTATDIALVVLTAVIWLPILVITGVVVAIVDGQPVFFTQERVGRLGRPVRIFKFRTMVPHEGPVDTLATDDDPRITRLGKMLRRYRLDEVPQLINVIRGELAIVGPRPEWVSTAERYRQVIPFYDQRSLIRPGITGWAQVNLGATSDERGAMAKLSYDFYYLKHMSPMLDLEVLARSIRTVFRGDARRRQQRPPTPTT